MKSTMKALVYGGVGKIELKEVPVPKIQKSTDALVRITKTTICGTDLGIIKGKVPTVKPRHNIRSRRRWHCGRDRSFSKEF